MLIIHLGHSGFPNGNATMKRIHLTFNAIKLGGFSPLIINKNSIHKLDNARRINRYKGIPYIYTSPILTRPDSLLVRNINKIFGYIGEFLLIMKKRKKIYASIFYENSLPELCYYRILSKLFKFKLVVQYVELRAAIPVRQKALLHLNDKLFDAYYYNFCDGVIVISEFLKIHSLSRSKSLPLIKIPAICNFDDFNSCSAAEIPDYMMYCGGIGYLSVIEFVLDVYSELQKHNSYKGKLLLAVGGGEDEANLFETLRIKINDSGYKDKIILKKDVPHDELINLYLNSELLIVPLRNTIQDIAGFHHKIGEYTAAGKPIISTDLGEMNVYFQDKVSAILVPEYTVNAYVEKLMEMLIDKVNLAEIGEKGKKVGQDYLNFKNYSIPLTEFICSI
jgi:glycosyltransferase involved in cell wall biosynthesis